MVAIMRALASSGATASPRRSSPELDAKARTCRAQLEDWVTCPSAKTPQGKARIAQISAKLDAIKQEIEKSGDTSGAGAGARPDAQPDAAARTGGWGSLLGAPSRVGTNVDTYA